MKNYFNLFFGALCFVYAASLVPTQGAELDYKANVTKSSSGKIYAGDSIFFEATHQLPKYRYFYVVECEYGKENPGKILYPPTLLGPVLSDEELAAFGRFFPPETRGRSFYAVAYVLNRPAETFYKGPRVSRETQILGGLAVAQRIGAVVTMSPPVNYRVESDDRPAAQCAEK